MGPRHKDDGVELVEEPVVNQPVEIAIDIAITKPRVAFGDQREAGPTQRPDAIPSQRLCALGERADALKRFEADQKGRGIDKGGEMMFPERLKMAMLFGHVGKTREPRGLVEIDHGRRFECLRLILHRDCLCLAGLRYAQMPTFCWVSNYAWIRAELRRIRGNFRLFPGGSAARPGGRGCGRGRVARLGKTGVMQNEARLFWTHGARGRGLQEAAKKRAVWFVLHQLVKPGLARATAASCSAAGPGRI